MTKIRALCLTTLLSTLALLVFGSMIHHTDASLSCPDWPTCYGQLLPNTDKAHLFIEQSHRLLASIIGLLTLVMSFMLHRKKSSKPELYHLSLITVGLVLLQGALGAITAVYQMPTLASTFHFAFSVVFFCSLYLLYYRMGTAKPLLTTREQQSFRGLWKPQNLDLIYGLLVIIALQMLLGAMLKHTGASDACIRGATSFFKCMDRFHAESVFWPNHGPGQLHMTHRYFALISLPLVLYCVVKCSLIIRSCTELSSQNKRTLLLSTIAPLFFTLLQILSGSLNIITQLNIIASTAHLILAFLVLLSCWHLLIVMKGLEHQLLGPKVYTFARDLLELTKPKLTALVVLTSIIGLLLAPEKINFFSALWALFLTWLLVMGACSLNCLIEIETDKKMLRTKDRSLPAGRIKPKTVLWIGLTMAILSLGLLLLTVNLTTGLLGLLATILYLFAYTPLKQKSLSSLFVGAISGAIPPVMGWSMVMGNFHHVVALSLFGILFIWQIPHFMAISLYHYNDYQNADIKIFPAHFGIKSTNTQIIFWTLCLILISIAPSYYQVSSLSYSRVALILGLAFFSIALLARLAPQDQQNASLWARRYFIGSIIYLPLLLAAMLLLK